MFCGTELLTCLKGRVEDSKTPIKDSTVLCPSVPTDYRHRILTSLWKQVHYGKVFRTP